MYVFANCHLCSTHKILIISSRRYERLWLKIQISMSPRSIIASSQALSPAPFQAKGGFPGNVKTLLPTRLPMLPMPLWAAWPS